jgi:hypothetical protein
MSMIITIDLPDSQSKILIYPAMNKAHFVFPFNPPITLSLLEAEAVCRQVAAEKRQARNEQAQTQAKEL